MKPPVFETAPPASTFNVPSPLEPTNRPPLFVQVCAEEILLSDSTRIVDNARAAGGVADIEIYSGLWHVFQAFARQVPESRAAVARIGAYIARTLR